MSLSAEPIPDLLQLVANELRPVFAAEDINIDDVAINLSRKLSEGDLAVILQPIISRRKLPRDYTSTIASKINTHIESLSPEDRSTHVTREAVAAGPYLNLNLNRSRIFSLISSLVFSTPKYGYTSVAKGLSAMVEHTSSNPNSPLHIGNLRNVLLGLHLSRLLSAVGFDVVEEFYVNDMGAQIGLTLLGWEEGVNEAITKNDYWTGLVYAVMNSFEEIQRAQELSFETLLTAVTSSNPAEELEKLRTTHTSSEQPLSSLGDLLGRVPGLIVKLLNACIEKWSGKDGKPTIYEASATLNLSYEQGDEESVKRFRPMVISVLGAACDTLARVNAFHDSFTFESELSWTGAVGFVMDFLVKTPYFTPSDGTTGGI
ncbi:hypothetical protein GEMRC1_007544 [Eukaryota sp. GEM-RC1]